MDVFLHKSLSEYLKNGSNVSYSHAFSIKDLNIGEEKSPVKCELLQSLGYFFIFLIIVGVLQNVYILVAFWLNKNLRSFYHMLIVSLMLVNFVGILIEYPIVIVNKLNCGYKINYFFSLKNANENFFV